MNGGNTDGNIILGTACRGRDDLAFTSYQRSCGYTTGQRRIIMNIKFEEMEEFVCDEGDGAVRVC